MPRTRGDVRQNWRAKQEQWHQAESTGNARIAVLGGTNRRRRNGSVRHNNERGCTTTHQGQTTKMLEERTELSGQWQTAALVAARMVTMRHMQQQVELAVAEVANKKKLPKDDNSRQQQYNNNTHRMNQICSDTMLNMENQKGIEE